MEFVEYEYRGQTFVTTPQGFVSTLTYANYRHNRCLAPQITPEEWQTVYGDTTAMEQQYQAELVHGT